MPQEKYTVFLNASWTSSSSYYAVYDTFISALRENSASKRERAKQNHKYIDAYIA